MAQCFYASGTYLLTKVSRYVMDDVPMDNNLMVQIHDNDDFGTPGDPFDDVPGPPLGLGISLNTPDNIFGSVDRLISVVEQYPIVSASIAPHAIYSVSIKTLEKVVEYAQKNNNLRIQIHVSEVQDEVDYCNKEFGKTPIALLDNMGFWNCRVTAAHCVCISDRDIG